MTPCPAIPKPPMERTYHGRWPMPPQSNRERTELWRRRYHLLTVEQTVEPIKFATRQPGA